MNLTEAASKRCRTCNIVKEGKDFYTVMANSDCLDWHCRACRRIARHAKKDYFYMMNKRWIANNPDKRKRIARISKRKQRALKLKIIESFTHADETLCLLKFNFQCFNCGHDQNLSIDHHKPLSEGHPLAPDNAVVLCRSCNSSKRRKMPSQFYSTAKLVSLTLKGIANFKV